MAWERWVAAPDVHGDMQDVLAVAAFHRFVEVYKPRHRIHLGDNWDCRPLRRKASEAERRESLIADWEMGRDFIDTFRPTVFLEGNHDKRIRDLAETGTGVMRDYGQQCLDGVNKLFHKLKCPVLPYDNRKGIYDLGNLRFMHGFGSGLYAARRMAQAYGSLVQGHLHTRDMVSIEGLQRRCVWVGGCLCRLDMEYASTNIASLKQQHGWPYGVVDSRTGDYQVWLAERIGDAFYGPQDWGRF